MSFMTKKRIWTDDGHITFSIIYSVDRIEDQIPFFS